MTFHSALNAAAPPMNPTTPDPKPHSAANTRGSIPLHQGMGIRRQGSVGEVRGDRFLILQLF